ncbi:MAG TPA: SCO family protein [Pyrinomonadaceae bacterium]|nr:SCO family protein [Pyrinomonadaceae bacterium]
MGFPFDSRLRAASLWLFLNARRLLLLAVCLLVASCARAPESGAQKRYELRGKVVSVNQAGGEVEVEHEAVAGLMEAMTMSFALKDADALRVVAPGDQIQAALVVGDGGFWLENPVITKVMPGGQPLASVAAGGAREPQAGDEVPDFKLVNQDGEPRHLAQYRGRPLLLTFIYTRCPDEKFCPLMSSNFAGVNRELEKVPTLRDGARLLSVTIDPAHDTPKVLRSYGAAHTENYSKENFARWEFATGDPEEIRRMANFFGLTYNAADDKIVHSLRTIVVGADGRVFKVYRGNEWKPSDAVADLERAAADAQAVK